ncbi:MAG: FliM/FliN family flagellar motor switch protein [Tabrizicola sp.]
MTDVIRRKIDRARPAQAEGAPGADRGWRLALARATRDAMGLDLDFRKLTIARLSLAEILEIAPERALLALLDGPSEGLGVIMLAPPVTAALIEMQTVGRLSTQATAPRRPSRIDAAMVAGVIDRALSGLDEALAEEADFAWAGGFRYASYLEEVRPLALMLEEDVYRVLTAEVALGGGKDGGPGGREGTVILVLPAEGRGECPVPVAEPEEAVAPHFTSALQAQVMQSDCRLDAVVGRLTLPLKQIMSLEIGQTLILPSAALDAISLETVEGRQVGRARLGQHRGMRALKLSTTQVAVPQPQQAPQPRQAPHQSADQSEGPPPELRAAG